jgi:pimeloyl-ACP methyl ester carboxylesterase
MRKIVTPVMLALLLGGSVSTAHPQRGRGVPGSVEDVDVDIGGRRLHASCTGEGSPTVILEAGFGDASMTWKAVQPAVAEFTRVCSYDRAGYGRSDPDPGTEMRTSRSVVEDLSRLLRAAGVDGPYVLVGHSFGGAYMRLFASRFPQDTVGMVLVDATHEDQFARFEAAGLLEALPPAGSRERAEIVTSLDEVRQALWRADVPLVVLSHGRRFPWPGASEEVATRVEAAWLELQRELASRSPRGRLVIAGRSGHYVHIDEPELVIEAIRDVVVVARSTAAGR